MNSQRNINQIKITIYVFGFFSTFYFRSPSNQRRRFYIKKKPDSSNCLVSFN